MVPETLYKFWIEAYFKARYHVRALGLQWFRTVFLKWRLQDSFDHPPGYSKGATGEKKHINGGGQDMILGPTWEKAPKGNAPRKD